jgi:hypothetical protein
LDGKNIAESQINNYITEHYFFFLHIKKTTRAAEQGARAISIIIVKLITIAKLP